LALIGYLLGKLLSGALEARNKYAVLLLQKLIERKRPFLIILDGMIDEHPFVMLNCRIQAFGHGI
jgi:hypothetical protein